MRWVILNQDGYGWTNESGWCEAQYDVFTDEERASFSLPIDGEWVRESALQML